jgi:hypothetical protein
VRRVLGESSDAAVCEAVLAAWHERDDAASAG